MNNPVYALNLFNVSNRDEYMVGPAKWWRSLWILGFGAIRCHRKLPRNVMFVNDFWEFLRSDTRLFPRPTGAND